MTELIAALDEIVGRPSNFQFGQNGHVELAWSHTDLEEQLIQFYFQCVRTDDHSHLSKRLNSMLTVLFTGTRTPEQQTVLVNLYRMIGQTRDVEGGKGEYTLAYMMIYEWSKFSMPLAKFALQMFVKGAVGPYGQDQVGIRPLGSWKDIKYMCDYVKVQLGGSVEDALQHPLVQYSIQLVTEQLKEDYKLYNNTNTKNTNSISLLTKWIPRERKQASRFAWLYPAISAAYFPEYIKTASTCTDKTVLERAQKKCNAQLRMLVATLNRHLDTVQVKMCAGRWSDIDHNKTTSITMQRGRKAFMNLTVTGNEKRSEDPDRIKCAENLSKYLMDRIERHIDVKGKNIGLEKFTADAYSLYNRREKLEYSDQYLYEVVVSDEETENDQDGYGHKHSNHQDILAALEQEKQILNSQWRDNAAKKNGHALKNFIAMVDLSGSMKTPNMQPYNAAVALGCRVAENSTLGKRVLAFASEPTWINFDGTNTFTDMADIIFKTSKGQGMSTNFYHALDVILAAIVQKKLSADVVQDMTLVIFSDMQINECFTYDQRHCPEKPWSTMCDVITQKYHDVGLEICGKPYKAPHILFWNLSSTDGFPSMATEKNVSMLSGFDPSVLELFCEEGMEGLQEMMPINMIYKILANKRYDPLSSVLLNEIVVKK